MAQVLRPLVVIPTYNERDNLRHIIPAILAVDSSLCILVVDDLGTDDTAGAVLELKADRYDQRLFLESRPRKLGLGSAYVLGLKWGLARGHDFLIQMDADWSHHPKYLAMMLRQAREADFVIGSRYMPGGKTLNWGLKRRSISRFASFYSRLILGADFTDFTGGFNGWSSSILQEVDLDTMRSDGYSFQIELKYRAYRLGYKHTEIPITFEDRRAGDSKMSFEIALEAAWRVWEFKVRDWRKAGLQV